MFLESVRWKGLGLDSSGAGRMPTLGRLASEGLYAKCYVGIPSTSKGQFEVLTARYPFPGLEVREAMRDRWDSIVWLLRERRGMRTYCFSAQYMAFQNMSGVLRACGVEQIFGPNKLTTGHAPGALSTSSFGGSDDMLLDMPARILAEGQSPFFAVLIPLAAHYPYNYPGKSPNAGSAIGSYWKSVNYTDDFIGRLIDGFRVRALVEDTLFVFVGDHGQAFNEHGTLIHGMSTYEEEICVPVVFWCADGRLRCADRLVARHIDIAPTIADLMGVTDPGYKSQGISLLRQTPPPAAYVSTVFGSVSRALVEGTEKYMYFPSDERVVRFDLEADPDEANALPVSEAKRNEVMQRLRAFDAYQTLLYQ